MPINLRPFADADYPRLAEIEALTWRGHAAPEADWRRRDGRFDHGRFFRVRYVADLNQRVAGWGQIGHMPMQHYPDKYRIDVAVDPELRRQGIGSALYERLLGEVVARGAEAVRAEANEAMPESIRFLERRGFRERSRSWESRLDVTTFAFDRFAGAERRAAEHGVEIVT